MATTTQVESRTKPGVFYTVTETEDGAECTCPDSFFRKRICGHIYGIWGGRAMARLFSPATGEAVEPWEKCWWVGCERKALPGAHVFCEEHEAQADEPNPTPPPDEEVIISEQKSERPFTHDDLWGPPRFTS